ncbi:ABC transporter ATP-binding protein [Pseudothermotoga thermarum]|uniref:Oligopeptide/dipeptide ABC transporter, ATPase subunit n=1 Tax=Pseudothermotoga thermarum DSM 5069 TaxID=688269 RepID=F7YUQ9_9THEM|nr:ABC transporter ATP-binding protein [Pseudothermotoga thermarum]AEH50244.1 oligopeptide/dipeptide ABC transporter, ATPase subunit [Pseudothermotoga thermarum DSM 5069]
MQTVIETQDLKSYYILDVFGKEKVVKAVDGVNIKIHQNEIYGIAGESGCGKTTLLRAIFGIIDPPLRLIGGKVLYHHDGQVYDLYALDPTERRSLRWKFVSYVPQGSMSVLNPVVKIKETFKDFLNSHLKGRTKEEYYELAKEHLKGLGLPPTILEAYPHQLSGGMRQRVTIALATLLKPKVIIADEPTTALDVVTQRGVIQLLKDIQSTYMNTIVLVTHDMGVHASLSTRIAVMYAGKIIEEAPTSKLFKNPKHPYTKFLINSLPRFGDKSRRTSAPGSPPSLAALPPGCSFHPRCPYCFEKCKVEVPPLREYEPDHKVACWLMEERIA